MHHRPVLEALFVATALIPLLLLVGSWLVFGSLYVVIRAVRSLHHPRARRI